MVLNKEPVVFGFYTARDWKNIFQLNQWTSFETQGRSICLAYVKPYDKYPLAGICYLGKRVAVRELKCPLIIGDLALSGVGVYADVYDYDNGRIGVAALRKF